MKNEILEALTIIEEEHNRTKRDIEIIKQAKQEIERLNNIINDLLDRQNEALRYIGNHLSLDSRYKHGNGDEELILVRKILNKHIKELKGSDKE